MSDPVSVQPRPRLVLPALVLAQLLATSLWFAANAVMPSLARLLDRDNAIADITTAVQLGFIAGTFTFAALAIADRLSPVRVFFVCALLAAGCNASIVWRPDHFGWVLGARFLVGFFLAGIYPVGMKIAVSWYPTGLGRALGFLVGALVLGTAFPHLVRALGETLAWQQVIGATSLAAVAGGLMVLIGVGDGPYRPAPGALHPRALLAAFHRPRFRASALGYFGHMWELYTFWAFIPFWLLAYQRWHGIDTLPLSLLSFIIIGIGALGCVGGGLLSQHFSAARIAATQLGISGLCCLLSPLLFLLPVELFLTALLIWGITVAGDSPLFSTLNAANAPPQLAGSALTLANCIGFSLSVVSLQFIDWASSHLSAQWLFILLVPGPLVGIIAMGALLKDSTHDDRTP